MIIYLDSPVAPETKKKNLGGRNENRMNVCALAAA